MVKGAEGDCKCFISGLGDGLGVLLDAGVGWSIWFDGRLGGGLIDLLGGIFLGKFVDITTMEPEVTIFRSAEEEVLIGIEANFAAALGTGR